MSFSPLKDLIPKAANKFHLHDEIRAAWVMNRASALIKEIFPEEVGQKIRAKRFKDGILWLSVSHSIIAHEVQLKSLELKEQLNRAFQEPIIKNIRTFQQSEQEETEI